MDPITRPTPRTKLDPFTANLAIANALGLDVTRVPRGGVTIRLEADGPFIDVTYRLYDAEVKSFLEGLKRYRLELTDDD